MREHEATTRAGDVRTVHRIPVGWRPVRTERRYIEVADADPENAAPVRDVLTWVVRFSDGFMWIDLAVDDSTGRVVRVERSR